MKKIEETIQDLQQSQLQKIQTKAIETRAGVLKEAEDVKKEAKTSFYLQYMGKEISTEEITQKVHEAWKTLGEKCR